MSKSIAIIFFRRLAVALPVLLLGACAAMPHKDDPSYAPTMPQAPLSGEQNNGAIYQSGTAMSLFDDVKAHRVGDIITIVLAESTSASKKAATDTKKSDSVDIANPTILGSSPQFSASGLLPLASNRGNTLANSLSSSQQFSGQGDSSQSNTLTGNVTVTVSRVLANGNLMVRGEKQVTINQGEEFVRISGIVRPVDVTPDNTVLSTQVADAHISYTGRGAVADSNAMGWLARFFNSPIWPF